MLIFLTIFFFPDMPAKDRHLQVPCPICQTLVKKTNYSSHMKTHFIKKILCETCGEEVDERFMSAHQKSHELKQYLCTHCPFFYAKSEEALSYHLMKKHSIVTENERVAIEAEEPSIEPKDTALLSTLSTVFPQQTQKAAHDVPEESQ